MKNYMCFVLAFCMLLSLTACGRSGATQSTSDQSTLHSASDVVTFSDPTLEAMVRGSMGKPKGNITMAEAETVTRLNLSVDWCQQYISQGSLIKNIGGLESFTNLENLDLSSQAVSDITPLSDLTKLTALSLNGNPIADIAPLAKLTNLKWLKLTGCVANDYSPLSELVNLNLLMLDKSTISDVSPLVALTNLKYLFLADSQIKNYMPLMEIYPNLEQSDFDASRTLAALGFTFNDGDKMALYQTDKYDIRINRAEWGAPPQPDWQNCIRVVTGTESGYKNCVGFYPEHNAYVVWMFNPQTQKDYTYVYDVTTKSFGCDRASMETIVQTAFGDVTTADVLLAPVQFFDNLLIEALGISVDTLCSMPFEKPTLKSVGFSKNESNASYTYEDKKSNFRITIHRPEWGDADDGNNLEWCVCQPKSLAKGPRKC